MQKEESRASVSNNLNQKEKQFLGKSYPLHEAIVNGRGKIKIADTVWLVSGPDQIKGSLVQVVGMNGTILEVKSIQ